MGTALLLNATAEADEADAKREKNSGDAEVDDVHESRLLRHTDASYARAPSGR
jgi:hypothetical protein